AVDGATRPRDAIRPTEPLAQAAVEYIVDEARLPGARDAGDGDEARERDVHVEVSEIVGGRPTDTERQGRDAPPPLFGQRDGATAGGILGGERAARLAEGRDRAGEQHLAAALSRPGTEVDDVIRGADDGGVVLDHDDRVALVAQAVEQTHESFGVPGME